MPHPPPETVHRDLIEWGVLEPDAPVRLTRRFRAALARAAAQLQAAEAEGRAPDGKPIERQVETAMAEFLTAGNEAGPEHRAFVLVVHVTSMPEAVRRFLGA